MSAATGWHIFYLAIGLGIVYSLFFSDTFRVRRSKCNCENCNCKKNRPH